MRTTDDVRQTRSAQAFVENSATSRKTRTTMPATYNVPIGIWPVPLPPRNVGTAPLSVAVKRTLV